MLWKVGRLTDDTFLGNMGGMGGMPGMGDMSSMMGGAGGDFGGIDFSKLGGGAGGMGADDEEDGESNPFNHDFGGSNTKNGHIIY